MAQNDKVLTVSFGAFSCTLEGFDDPVETLKEVTEYFRALSASDPGFGDEAKLPDTENLARLIQGDDAQTVDIRANESGNILLRAEDADFDRSDAEEAEESDAARNMPSLDEVFGPSTSKPAPDRDATDTIPEFFTETEPTKGSIADKLQRIRAIVAHNETGTRNDDLAEDDAQTAEFFAGRLTDDLSAVLKAGNESEPSKDEPQDPDRGETSLNAFDKLESGSDSDDLLRNDPAEQDSMSDAEENKGKAPAPIREPEAAPQTSAASPEYEADRDQAMKRVLSNLIAPEDETAQDTQPASIAEDDSDEDFSVPYLLKPEEMISDGRDEDDAFDELQQHDSKHPELEPARREKSGAERVTLHDRSGTTALPNQDSDLERLMAVADERMGEPEFTHTRDTYSQMRAAVAAASVEHSPGDDSTPEEDESAYHVDLASVMRPGQPAPTRPGRPAAGEQQAPLKLVTEQRVDLEDRPLMKGPVRPRRVYSAQTDEDVDSGEIETSFSEFAAEHGATEMPDVLEAAVSYLSFVEGRKQFSRPQLMNKLRQIDDGSYDREDSLRSFGNLLREGKIEKAGSGRFTASDAIGFRPNDRAAG